jgi:hypothetical protein
LNLTSAALSGKATKEKRSIFSWDFLKLNVGADAFVAFTGVIGTQFVVLTPNITFQVPQISRK